MSPLGQSRTALHFIRLVLSANVLLASQPLHARSEIRVGSVLTNEPGRHTFAPSHLSWSLCAWKLSPSVQLVHLRLREVVGRVETNEPAAHVCHGTHCSWFAVLWYFPEVQMLQELSFSTVALLAMYVPAAHTLTWLQTVLPGASCHVVPRLQAVH